MSEPLEPRPSLFAPDASRLLSPRLRTVLYVVAGGLVALWAILQLYGAGGFFALLGALGVARLAYRWRPSLNVAFGVGVGVFLVFLTLWGSLLAERWETATATATPPVVRAE